MARSDVPDELDDDLQLSELRSVFRSMRDEEPSERGLDALLAAARTQAEEMKPRARPAPWWRRVLDTLRRPPVLALASVAVLLGGALVVTQHRDELVDAPMSAGDAPGAAEEGASHGSSASAARAPVDRVEDTQRATSRADAEAEAKTQAKAKAQEIARGDAADRRALAEEHRRREARSRGAIATGGAAPAGRASRATPDAVAPTTAPPVAPSPTRAPKQAGRYTLDAAADLSPAPAPAAEDAALEVAPAPAAKDVDLDALIRRCVAAAARRDCPAVRVLARQIERADAAAYRARVATEPAVKRCLSLDE